MYVFILPRKESPAPVVSTILSILTVGTSTLKSCVERIQGLAALVIASKSACVKLRSCLAVSVDTLDCVFVSDSIEL